MLTGGLPVTGYFLEVRMAHLPWTRVNKFPIVDTKGKVKRLHPGIEYEFRLTALSDNGCGEYSTVTGPVIPTTENRPSQPGSPLATVNGTSVNLEWSTSYADNHTRLLRYVIRGRETTTGRTVMYAFTDGKAGPTICHTLSNGMLKPGTPYEFAVAACNISRLGPYSSYSQSVQTSSGDYI